jgi:hypothetical protein
MTTPYPTLRSRSYAGAVDLPALLALWPARPVAGEGEALVALHRAAFSTEHMTAAERLSWMRLLD